MNHIIQYLLDGYLEEKLAISTDKMAQLILEVSDNYDKLVSILDAEQNNLLEKFKDSLDTHNLEELHRYFSEGFIAGIKIGMLINKEQLSILIVSDAYLTFLKKKPLYELLVFNTPRQIVLL